MFFTADFHLGHTNIMQYCMRPFTNVDEMNEHIIRSMNACTSAEDDLVSLGDFSIRNVKCHPDGTRLTPREWESCFKAKLIHILGNHDYPNKLKQGFHYVTLTFSSFRVRLQHRPMNETDQIPDEDFIVCGHVHDAWRTKWIRGKFHINVGVDQWDYKPVDKSQCTGLYVKALKTALTKESRDER